MMLATCLLALAQQPERSLENDLYRAQMFAAEAALRLGEPAVAREWLDATNPKQRGIEWGVHDAELEESSWRATVESGHVTALAVDGEGKFLMCGTSKGALELRDMWDSCRIRRTYASHSGAITQMGFDSLGLRLVTASADRTVKVWDVPHCSLRTEFKGHGFPLGGAAFSPDGKLIGSCSYERPPEGVIGTLHIWNPDDGTIVRTLHGGRKPLVGLAFSPDGKHVAAGSWNFCVFVWPVAGGEPVRCEMPDEGKYRAVDDVAWSPDSKLVIGASRDGTARVWNATDGQLVATLRVHTDAVRAVAFDASGSTLLTASADGSVGLWNSADWTLRGRASGHVDDVEDVVFHPGGSSFFTSSLDRSIRAWNSQSTLYDGAVMRNEAATYAVRFSPDDAVLATCSYDGRIQLWSVAAFDLLASWQAHPPDKSCHALEWTSDVRRLVSGSWEPVVRVWDVFTRKELVRIEVPNGTTDLAVAPDDGLLAVAGGKTVTVWHLDKGTKVHEFAGHSAAVSSVSISPDSRLCVSTARDQKAMIWELDTGKQVHELLTAELDVTDAAFTPDGKLVVVTCRNGDVSTYRTSDGSNTGISARSRHGIDHIAISPDGSRVALASQFAALVDLRAGAIVGELRAHADGTYDVDFDSKGRRLATCSTDKTIAILDVRPLREREIARTRALASREQYQSEIDARVREGMKLSEIFATWMSGPISEVPRTDTVASIEYWIQQGPSALR